MTPSAQLEAVLFFKSEPLSIKELAKMLGISESAVNDAAQQLKNDLQGRGLALVSEGDTYMLATAPDAGEMIARITKEELEKDPGKAGMEVLAILLYQGPQTRAQIDYIRGVNSTFALRSLMMRGLVERDDNPQDARSFLYKPTLQLLTFLGVTERSELPAFEETRATIATLLENNGGAETSPDVHGTGNTDTND